MSALRPLDTLAAPEQRAQAGTLGMWVFLATELMFFGPLFFGYWYGRLQFPEAFAAASRETDVVLGAANTTLLLTSSALMAAAVEAAQLGARRLAVRLLGATAALGVVFLIVKGAEYHHEWQAGLFPGDASVLVTGGRLFFLLYFAMTGVHALHLVIGITVVAAFAVTGAGAKPRWGPGQLGLVGLYWHFVDALWIFLFPLLYLLGRSG